MSSSTRIDQEKSLELIQKTYPNQNDHQGISTIMHPITTMRKISNHQLSRKSSIHDINEVFKEDFHKKLIEIHEKLSRLKYFFEMNHCYPQMLNEYYLFKNDILEKTTNLISKFSQHHQMRGSIGTTNLIDVSQLVYLIEFIRNEFLKIEYLFQSTILHTQIDLPNVRLKQIELFEENLFHDELNQLKRDSNYLEEQAFILSQRYYCEIPDWKQFDESMNKSMLMKPTTKINRNETTDENKMIKQNQRRSSISSNSNGNHSFQNEFMQKCFSFCCLCTPKYI